MRILFFLLLIAAPILVHAQESLPTTEEKKTQEEKTNDDPGTQNKIKEETPDTFDPTEKLSEDIAAPFPVDI